MPSLFNILLCYCCDYNMFYAYYKAIIISASLLPSQLLHVAVEELGCSDACVRFLYPFYCSFSLTY